MRRRLWAAAALTVGGCVFDPHARLDNADLRVVVNNIDTVRAVKVSISVLPVGGGPDQFIRSPSVDGRKTIEIYFPTLPEGRYRLEAKEWDAAAEKPLRCAVYGHQVDAAESPQDKTFDMVADEVPCGAASTDDAAAPTPDAGPGTDAEGPTTDAGPRRDAFVKPDGATLVPDATPPVADATRPGVDAAPPPPDAEVEDDVRRPPGRDDMRVKVDADPEEH
jgi:hypothetical protein